MKKFNGRQRWWIIDVLLKSPQVPVTFSPEDGMRGTVARSIIEETHTELVSCWEHIEVILL